MSENSTSSETPSVNGVTSTGKSSSSASSAGAAGSSGAQYVSKAYEITKNIIEDDQYSFLKFIALAVVCAILLIVGYRRKENEDITD